MSAGCLLVRESGCQYVDFVGQTVIPANGNLIAANHLLVAAIARTIAPLLPAELR
jgi:fructose-1,6-bisphosphatase/inositol monophosphatase family enzyme